MFRRLRTFGPGILNLSVCKFHFVAMLYLKVRRLWAYAVATRSGKVLKTLETRQEAIDWAKGVGCGVYVAQVRDTSKGNSERWIEI
jgi:hypothetical protein